METITLSKSEYEQLKESIAKIKIIDTLIHQPQDAIAATYGAAKNKEEQIFSTEVKNKLAEELTSDLSDQKKLFADVGL